MTDLTTHDELRPSIEKIYELQREIGKLPQADVPIRHDFSKGVYARTIMLSAGMAAVGKMHATEHLMIVCGDVEIMTDDGMKRLQGYHVLNSLPGVKRAAYAHEDTVITTIHLTEETDLARIEAAVILPERPDLIEGEAS